jgi:hypothetical protein
LRVVFKSSAGALLPALDVDGKKADERCRSAGTTCYGVYSFTRMGSPLSE